MRKIYLHAGLHKTGTTALQQVLFNNKENLIGQGFLYPDCGIPANFHGHHNIAWQLARDRRFRPEFGSLEMLLKEIQGSSEQTILLSSEDFECSLLHPHRLQKIHSQLLGQHLHVCYVVYLRKPVDYVQSLYFELLKTGFADEFHAFARRILVSKRLEFREWEFVFNYAEISRSLASLKDAELVFRDYDDLVEGNTVADFCDLAGIDCQKLEIPDALKQVNRSLAPVTLLKLFIRNRTGVPMEGALSVVEEMLSGEGSDLILSGPARERFQALNANNGLFKSPSAQDTQMERPAGLSVEKVFSFETCGLALDLMRLQSNLPMKKQLIGQWRKWAQLAA